MLRSRYVVIFPFLSLFQPTWKQCRDIPNDKRWIQKTENKQPANYERPCCCLVTFHRHIKTVVCSRKLIKHIEQCTANEWRRMFRVKFYYWSGRTWSEQCEVFSMEFLNFCSGSFINLNCNRVKLKKTFAVLWIKAYCYGQIVPHSNAPLVLIKIDARLWILMLFQF